MDHVEQLLALYDRYQSDFAEVLRASKPTDGILGMGNGPQDHPCHSQYDQQVEALIRQVVAEVPSGDEAARLTACLLRDEKQVSDVQCVQLMLMAVQRHALLLIPFLSPTDAASLLAEYAARYPFFRRFPAQSEVMNVLKKQAR